MTIQEKQQSMHEKDLQRLNELCLMDDDFFSEALDGKKDAVGYILNTVLERADLKVVRTSAQVEYKSATKHSIRLDVEAEDTQGRVYDIEIQRADKGTGARRARYHSSMIDRTLLPKGVEFEELKDTYVIFITENDKFKEGVPLYHVERKITEKNNALFGDGAHIIYVNGEFCDLNHPVGQLMYDFNCKNASDMLNPLLADEVRYLKETEGGKGQMSRILEEMREEAAAEAATKATHDKAVETAMKMLERGRDTMAEIAEMTGLSVEEVEKLASQNNLVEVS